MSGASTMVAGADAKATLVNDVSVKVSKGQPWTRTRGGLSVALTNSGKVIGGQFKHLGPVKHNSGRHLKVRVKCLNTDGTEDVYYVLHPVKAPWPKSCNLRVFREVDEPACGCS